MLLVSFTDNSRNTCNFRFCAHSRPLAPYMRSSSNYKLRPPFNINKSNSILISIVGARLFVYNADATVARISWGCLTCNYTRQQVATRTTLTYSGELRFVRRHGHESQANPFRFSPRPVVLLWRFRRWRHNTGFHSSFRIFVIFFTCSVISVQNVRDGYCWFDWFHYIYLRRRHVKFMCFSLRSFSDGHRGHWFGEQAISLLPFVNWCSNGSIRDPCRRWPD